MKNISRRTFVQNLGLGVGATTMTTSLSSFTTLLQEKQAIYQGKKLNIALCGLGRYANILAKGLEETGYCKLAGIITGTPAKAQVWKEKYNLPEDNIYNYQNFDTIKNNKDIDLVYVVLPNGMHKEYSIRAARAGKHVIVEKPMALNEKDLRSLQKCTAIILFIL